MAIILKSGRLDSACFSANFAFVRRFLKTATVDADIFDSVSAFDSKEGAGEALVGPSPSDTSSDVLIIPAGDTEDISLSSSLLDLRRRGDGFIS